MKSEEILRIAVLPGDGIGPEVIAEGIKILRTVEHDLKNIRFELKEFSVGSITEGTDALGDVTIRVEASEKVYTGRGSSTDIIVASAKAYVNALNKLISIEGISSKND